MVGLKQIKNASIAAGKVHTAKSCHLSQTAMATASICGTMQRRVWAAQCYRPGSSPCEHWHCGSLLGAFPALPQITIDMAKPFDL